MTISSTTSKDQHNGNGSATSFNYTFKILDQSHLEVIKTSTAGVDSVLVITTDYTVSGVGVDAGGSISYPVSGTALATGEKLTIRRKMDFLQSTDLQNQGGFFAETHEDAFDRQTMYALQVSEEGDRTLKAPVTDPTSVDMTMPGKDTRKGTVLAFNATSGDPEAGPTIVTTQTVAGISSDISTVAGISANVTAVAADAADIGAVAGKATEIGLLGTSATVADLAILGTSDVVADMNTLAVSDVVADMNTLGTADVVSDMNTLGTADVVSDMNLLATSDIVTDMNLLATSANVAAMALLGTSDAVSDMNTLGTSDVVADMNLLGTADVVADMNTLAVSDVISDMNTLGTADVVTDLNTLGTADVVTDMNTLGTSGNVTNMNTVAGSIADVNRYANEYKIASTAPSSPSEGDLWYDSSANILKYYTGSTWSSISPGIADVVSDTSPQLGGALDLNGNTITGLVIGTNVQAYDADLDTVSSSGIGTSANQMVRLNGSSALPAVSGANLTSLTSGNLTGALPAISGASLTGLGIPAGTVTSLWNGSVTDAEITLSADIDNYHYLCFLGGTRYWINVIPVGVFKSNTYGSGSDEGHILTGYDAGHVWVKWTSDTTIDVNPGDLPIYRVFGVK